MHFQNLWLINNAHYMVFVWFVSEISGEGNNSVFPSENTLKIELYPDKWALGQSFTTCRYVKPYNDSWLYSCYCEMFLGYSHQQNLSTAPRGFVGKVRPRKTSWYCGFWTRSWRRFHFSDTDLPYLPNHMKFKKII